MEEKVFDFLRDLAPARPERGVKLFSSAGVWEQNAIVDAEDLNWDICVGYRKAAETIVDSFIERRAKFNDYSSFHSSLAFPVIFLYRHYLELRLKELFIGYGHVIGEPTKVQGHKLTSLWKKLRNRAAKAFTESVPEVVEDMDVLEEIIREFSGIDPNSESFRYPVDNQSEVMFPPFEVDLLRLKATMNWVSYLLDGWSVGVYESFVANREGSIK